MNIINNYLDDLINSINTISSDRSYWLVRTMGGEYYDYFVSNNIISIGYNEISLDEIKSSFSVSNPLMRLKEIINSKNQLKDNNDNGISANYAAPQIIKFYSDIKKGDIVIIPSTNSYKIQYGIVDSDVFELSSIEIDDSCDFTKRRSVSWLGEELRNKINPKLQLAFSSFHIISNLNKYSQYIDSLYSDFYMKGQETYLTIKIDTETDIDLNDFNVIHQLISFVNEFMNEMNIEGSEDNIKVKLYLESPGYAKLKSYSKKLTLLGAAIILFNGGNIEYKSLKIESNGLIENMIDFYDRWQDAETREVVREKIKNLKIQDPKDIERLINSTKNPRNSY